MYFVVAKLFVDGSFWVVVLVKSQFGKNERNSLSGSRHSRLVSSSRGRRDKGRGPSREGEGEGLKPIECGHEVFRTMSQHLVVLRCQETSVIVGFL